MTWMVLYPGQGSQSEGMGRHLLENFRAARLAFEEASDAVHLDLKQLCTTGSAQDLSLTQNTQPALLTVSVATYRVLNIEWGFSPALAAGHSVGEYAALVNAEAISLADAVRAVRFRGEAMQSAVPLGVGAMAAVMGWEESAVVSLCKWASENSDQGVLEPANFNAPGQVVVSGHKACLDWASQHYQSGVFPGGPARLKMIPLKVSAPFHCSLMRSAEEKMREFLSTIEFSKARYPIVQNLTAEPVEAPAALRENLIRQVSAPVRWIETMQVAAKMGFLAAVECGSGKVLQGLGKKIVGESFQCWGTQSFEDIRVLEGVLTKNGGV